MCYQLYKHSRISGSISAVRSAVTKLAGNNPSPLHDEPRHQFRSLQSTETSRMQQVVVVVIVCITSHVTSTIAQRNLQPIEAVVGHPPPALPAGSC